MPTTIVQTADEYYLKYMYSASGAQLQTKEFREKKLIKTTDYCGQFVYVNGQLSYIMIDGARITFTYKDGSNLLSPIPLPSESGYLRDFEFYLTDHLGNVRVVYKENEAGEAEIEQENDYYPYGMLMKSNSVKCTNNFLYNGKEQQNFTGYYAYGFRQFDSQIARWHSIDKLAESTISASPYSYVLGNPVSFVDILGLVPDGGETWIGGVFGTLMRDMPEEQFNVHMQNGGGNWDGTETANDWRGYEVLLGWTEPDENGHREPIYGITGAGGYGTLGSFSEFYLQGGEWRRDNNGNYYYQQYTWIQKEYLSESTQKERSTRADFTNEMNDVNIVMEKSFGQVLSYGITAYGSGIGMGEAYANKFMTGRTFHRVMAGRLKLNRLSPQQKMAWKYSKKIRASNITKNLFYISAGISAYNAFVDIENGADVDATVTVATLDIVMARVGMYWPYGTAVSIIYTGVRQLGPNPYTGYEHPNVNMRDNTMVHIQP